MLGNPQNSRFARPKRIVDADSKVCDPSRRPFFTAFVLCVLCVAALLRAWSGFQFPVSMKAPSVRMSVPSTAASFERRTPVTSASAWCSGVVMTPARRAIPNATVTIRSNTLTRSVVTNGLGSFRFEQLPAGVYAVSASHEGFVPLYLGQTDPLEPMRTIAIDGGRQMDVGEIVLQQAGAMHGRILAPDRRPVGDALVGVHRVGDRGMDRALVVDGLINADPTSRLRAARTDDAGRFAMRDLPPGRYVVSAAVDDSTNQAMASVGGRLYSKTYFEHSIKESGARDVRVEAGADPYVEWSLRIVPAVRLTGAVVTSNGLPASGAIVRVITDAQSSSSSTPIAARSVGRKGTFDIAVPSGQMYTLLATSGSPWLRPGVQRDIEAAVVAVGKLTRDRTELAVHTTPAGVVAGRVVAAAGEAGESPPAGTRVSAIASGTGPFKAVGSAPVRADGSFELHNVFGCEEIYVAGASGSLVVERAYIDEQQLARATVCVKDGERVSGIRLLVRRPLGQVVGSVTSPSGQLAPNSVVVLFPHDEAKWTDPLGHYVRVSRTDGTGRFVLREVVGGAYHLVAVDRLSLADAYAASRLVQLRALATSVEVPTDGRAAARLKLATWGATLRPSQVPREARRDR